ncbi:MAG TPA: hypothetical protein VFX16_37405 [Pseudonocardiaceae bacterium]|nr:hypothetical protein [Pseudonocardiaceae bacterium]
MTDDVATAVRDADGVRHTGSVTAMPVFSVTKMFIAAALSRPRPRPGEFLYSNLGYRLLGAASNGPPAHRWPRH